MENVATPIDNEVISQVFRLATGQFPKGVKQIKDKNVVFEVSDSNGALFYLKFYNKGWGGYGADTWPQAAKEATAWRLMRDIGLRAPEILACDLTTHNPIGQPYLLSRGLAGRPLTTVLAEVGLVPDIFEALGAFLGKLHSCRFAHPGPIINGPPSAPPSKDEYHFLAWTRFGLESWIEQTRKADSELLPDNLRTELDTFYREQAPRAISTMGDPRFLHGDCHAHQFFLSFLQDTWTIEGVVDLECAQSGIRGQDIAKLFIELIGALPKQNGWLQSFWSGYGEVYDFDLLRFHLLIFEHVNFKCLGPRSWLGTREEIVRHILSARDYQALAQR